MTAAVLPDRPGTVVCRLPGPGRHWALFTAPDAVITATSTAEVLPALETVERHLARGGYAAGGIAYEAAAAFDPAQTVRADDDAPPLLLWFGLYPRPSRIFTAAGLRALRAAVPPGTPPELTPQTAFADYAGAIDRIGRYLAEGDIYQANFTIRAAGNAGNASPPAQWLELFRRHPVPFAAYVNTGAEQWVSLSPELFLHRRGRRLESSPMKGTAPRRPGPEEDRAAAAWLAADAKNRAENLMIVDMVRNDLGRVCHPGSIAVRPLFRVDTYATVHQMISTVHGELDAATGLTAVLRAAFPAASITGAPKIRAMEIIRELEDTPRGIYTGAIGCAVPGGDFLFNVAIRTLTYRQGACRLGIGGGIVADSTAASEWQECLLKSAFAAPAVPDFDVLETMIYRPGEGIYLAGEHLARAARSQRYFRRPWREKDVRRRLDRLELPAGPARIRMTVDATGKASFTVTPLSATGWSRRPARLIIAAETVAAADPFRSHKTTRREICDRWHHRALEQGADEAVFTNERGEVTEGSIASLFVRLDGRWYTPPRSCGLLDGLWRRLAMTELDATERIITVADLRRAEAIRIGNSVRGGTDAVLSD